MANPVEKPAHLKSGRRAFVKRNGKKLVRKIASYQSRQSKVPDTPKIANDHFGFLSEFTDNWEVIQEEAREVLKFRDAIPTFHEVSPDQYRLSTGSAFREKCGACTKDLRNFGESPKSTNRDVLYSRARLSHSCA